MRYLILLLLISSTSFRQMKYFSRKQLDKFLKVQMQSLDMPGLSIAVIRKGKIVYHRALGVTNTSAPVMVDDQSIFEAASLSKPVFAYLAMKMVDKGLLDLDKARMLLMDTAQGDYNLAKVLAPLDTVFRKEVAVPLGMRYAWFRDSTALHTEALSYAHFLLGLMKDEMHEEMFKAQTSVAKDYNVDVVARGLGLAIRSTRYGIAYQQEHINGNCLFYKEKKSGYVFFTNCNKGAIFNERLQVFLEIL